MQIGESSYKQCPECGKMIEFYPGPFFVHYYGLTEWSDGETFQELPSLKETNLQRCPHCNKFYWYKKKLGGLTFYEYYEALLFFETKYSKKSLIDSIFPKLDKYYQKKQNLLYIRLCILRKFNDRIRIHPLANHNIKNDPIPERDKIIFLENATNLINLLKELEPNNHLLIAELYRNLGLFEKSKNALNNVKDENIKRLLLNEINKHNRDVVIIKQPLTTHNRH
jgi:hypothetical protein